MGSIISAIEDDYEDYEWLCKRVGVAPVGLYSGSRFYDHKRELEIQLKINVKNTEDHILGEN